MSIRYNTEAASTPYDISWIHTDGLLDSTKNSSIDCRISDTSAPNVLPRAKIVTIQTHPLSTMCHTHEHFYHPQSLKKYSIFR
ncbi:unnamed protein product [Adineta ricciae]|uniref:Uncharacterized protein n=1 Tax=Adineta ricciae TaxID=249248 RepID=A0A814QCK0_ADIRI|nr:unnamed protein product [Adineta ricciae]